MPRLKWILALPVVALVLALGGTWTYINVLREDVPARLTLEGTVGENLPATTATTAADAATSVPVSLDGKWVATTGSQAGYRVDEILFGQHVEAVGRTGNVDGAVTISGTTVESAAISIDLASVTSAESRRDNQFRG
ncbi:MAG TPA: YceI family protein, partial [Acidimicrobiia bacterium]|nr:YceI family protein [Acidimicrobiia bacterium]